MPDYQERQRTTSPTSDHHDAAPLPKPSGTLSAAQIKTALTFNNTHWKDPHRSELLAKLRVEHGGSEFTEEDVRAVAAIQKREGVAVDGKLAGPTMAALLRGGLHLTEVKAKPEEVRLVFYPGEFEDLAGWRKAKADALAENGGKPLGKEEFDRVGNHRPPGHGTIYVEFRGTIVEAIQARGGPPFSMKDREHTADPSKAGTYKLGEGKSVVTSAWGLRDKIAWGAPFRMHDNEVQFKNPGEDWQFASGPKSVLNKDLKVEHFKRNGELIKEWRHNDFGQTAFEIQGSPGLFVHTSPDTEDLLKKEEEEHKVHEPLQLDHSHGCLHVEPLDRNRLMTTGYLQKGVTLVIKRYDEYLDPKAKNRK